MFLHSRLLADIKFKFSNIITIITIIIVIKWVASAVQQRGGWEELIRISAGRKMLPHHRSCSQHLSSSFGPTCFTATSNNRQQRFELVNLTAMIMTDGLEDSSPFKVAAAFRAGSKVYHQINTKCKYDSDKTLSPVGGHEANLTNDCV